MKGLNLNEILSADKSTSWGYLLHFQQLKGLLQQQNLPGILGEAQHLPLNKK